ncbi:hypothetical protein [Nonomuraea sp. NPDC050202]|jgi:hypothetical protein|uniref:hypothetical protein n=1 Tax=unclassified Nonomuraea TaxID=2593643 RepID=UPI00340F0B37
MSFTTAVDKRSQANNAKREQGLDQTTKIWNVTNYPTRDEAAQFVNYEPAQGPGEAVFSNCADGTVDVYYYL